MVKYKLKKHRQNFCEEYNSSPYLSSSHRIVKSGNRAGYVKVALNPYIIRDVCHKTYEVNLKLNFARQVTVEVVAMM